LEINARIDYALRAVLLLAEAQPDAVAGTTIAQSQQLPPSYLHAVLSDLRRAGLVYSLRGITGGYTLSRPAAEITIADVLTALDANLLRVRGVPPTRTTFHGAATGLETVWQAAEAAIRTVLEKVTLDDIVSNRLPGGVVDLSRTLNPS
jgi:Rrf2 family protein